MESAQFSELRLFVSGWNAKQWHYVGNWLKVRVKILQFRNKRNVKQEKVQQHTKIYGSVECSRMAQIIRKEKKTKQIKGSRDHTTFRVC